MDFILTALRVIGVLLLVIMVFNLMIVVHELGHFLAAKWRGLKIEAFQIWFGKPLWKKTVNGVDYGLGSIPAGGFVRLPQMAPMGALEGGTESTEPLPAINPADKIIVAFAGPLFSFGLACVFALIVYAVGIPDTHLRTTQIGWVNKDYPAYKDGLRPGDRILAVDGTPVDIWDGPIDSVKERIAYSTGDTITFRVERPGVAQPMDIPVHYKIDAGTWNSRQGLRTVGIVGGADVVVAKVFENSPAALAGLKEDDLVTSFNDQPIYNSMAIDDFMETNPGKPVKLGVKHEIQKEDRAKGTKEKWQDQVETVTVIPVTPTKPEGHKPSLGALFGIYEKNISEKPLHPSPLRQVSDALTMMFRTAKGFVAKGSSITAQQLSGPVKIFTIYYRLFEMPDGWKLVLWFSVILNVNLALINMFPFPVLDGGHIVMGFMEMIRRRPVMNLRVLEFIQTACALLLFGFMLFVTWYDSWDFFKKGSKEPDDAKQEFAAPAK